MKATGAAVRFEVTSAINVTPMIDVMLVLLIIFMTITPALVQPVALPQARTAVPAREDRVTLGIGQDGAFFLDDHGRVEAVAADRLTARLAAAYAGRDGDHVLYLKADARAGYGGVLTALEAARQAGVSRMAALTSTEPPRSGP